MGHRFELDAGHGHLVAGRLTGTCLSGFADVVPLRVQHAGTRITVTPGGAEPLGDAAYADP